MSGTKHFRARLEGRPFQLWTDHKPLIFALHRVSPPTSGRQQRHLAFISEYTNQLVYLPSTSNVVADALSRPAAFAAGVEWVCAPIADKSPLDLKDMALRQILCPTRRPPPQLPNDLARAPTMFVRRDGQVPLLQPLYDGPYTVIHRSLHFFTLHIGDKVDKVDKVSTLRLKPCTDPTVPPVLPRVRGRPPAAVRFRDFPPRRPTGCISLHSNQQIRAGIRFPLARRQGFWHAPPLTSRPPTSRPGGSPVEAAYETTCEGYRSATQHSRSTLRIHVNR